MIHLNEFGNIYKSRVNSEILDFVTKNFPVRDHRRLINEVKANIMSLMTANGLTFKLPISVKLELRDESTVAVSIFYGFCNNDKETPDPAGIDSGVKPVIKYLSIITGFTR